MSRPSSGGMSRPSGGSFSPGATRPSTPGATRPSTPGTSRPSTPGTTRPGTPGTTRPGTPSTTRPGATRPSQGQLQSFLDLPKPSTGVGTATRPAPALGGGAAADFLQNRPSTGQLPAQSRPGFGQTRPADNRGDRLDNRGDAISNRGDRLDNRGERLDNRGDAIGNRGDRLDNRQDFVNNRPDRIENRQQRQQTRQTRRDQVRGQVGNRRYDFWRRNPHWRRWGVTRPYRWATWTAVTAWFPWGWSQPVSYNYGDNVYYQDNSVYYGDNAVATTEQYAEQAQGIAQQQAAPADDAEWMPLGVFAITQDGAASGPAPTMMLQLAVSKQGVIGGTFYNSETEMSNPVQGAVDQKTQRTAWTAEGKQWPVMETGVFNLTKDEAPVLIHFENGQSQQWLLVRLEEPAEGGEQQP